MDYVRHCPRCRTDYRPEIQICAECGGDLETRTEEFSEEERPVEPPAGEYRSLYYSGDITDLGPLTGPLNQAGIPFRIGALGEQEMTLVPHHRFHLMVRDEDREQAREILSHLADPSGPVLADTAAEATYDPERGYRACPACQAALPAGVRKCPDCGLSLRGSPEPLLCGACHWEVGPSDATCPNCGATLED
jgi:predicted amidophosphoribosyltransferase